MPAAAAVRRRDRVEMRPEGGKTVTVRGTGSPGGEGADAGGLVIVAGSAPCKETCWTTAVAAARASAESVPPS